MVSGQSESGAGVRTAQGAPATTVEPRLVIGEGKEEVRFFKKMIEHMNIEGMQVEEYGGKPKLEGYLGALVKRTGHEKLVSLGITADADDSAVDTFAKVRNALRANGLPEPVANGLPATQGIKVGIFIFPDGSSSGMLEDVCMASICGEPETSCIDEYLACVREKTGRQCDGRNMAKARVHAWLASHPKPDLRLAEAAEAGYWDLDNGAFTSFREFLGRL